MASTMSTYRAAVGVVAQRAHSYIWLLVLPAAAECTASVWFPSVSFGRLDLQLAALNVSGALFEGFFAAWESGNAVASGPIGDVLSFIADDMRGSFLSTYTSWAGMVGFAAALAHSEQTLLAGFAYMIGCVVCGFFAHALGELIACALFPARPKGKASSSSKRDASSFTAQNVLLGGLVGYIASTYLLLTADKVDFVDSDVISYSELPALISFLDADENRLLVAMACSIAGAASGNALGNIVDSKLPNGFLSPEVPAGTLVCNALFALFGVSLNVFTLRQSKYGRSVLLQSCV